MPLVDIYRLDQFRIDGAGGSGNAQPGDVLKGKTFTNDDGEQLGTRDPGRKTAEGIGYPTLYSGNTYRFEVTGLTFRPGYIGVYHKRYDQDYVYIDRNNITANVVFYRSDQNSVTFYNRVVLTASGFYIYFNDNYPDLTIPIYWVADE
ncbi:hypothetical protein [Paenibacillus chibensis]|uniref:hypothetical protein n=1 Tax=Paenibacillus chibensis TaxID=59846 RepID=UPI000FD83788|nr:hypothetical protein [Paenibacillus chibensis]MEC0370897.1 hypothetical protein [Paenibacillus chibensis]